MQDILNFGKHNPNDKFLKLYPRFSVCLRSIRVEDFTRLTEENRLEAALHYNERRLYLRMLKGAWFHVQMGMR